MACLIILMALDIDEEEDIFMRKNTREQYNSVFRQNIKYIIPFYLIEEKNL